MKPSRTVNGLFKVAMQYKDEYHYERDIRTGQGRMQRADYLWFMYCVYIDWAHRLWREQDAKRRQANS